MAILDADDYFSARLSCWADLTIIQTIKDRLSKENKLLFKKSCFGQFYDFEKIPFQGQLYLHLLFKQDKSMKGDELVFHINNGETQFGPMEFALVTGLKFGPKPVIPYNTKFYKAVFGKKIHLYVRDVQDVFMNASSEEDKVESDIILKLALLWVLYGILLMKDNTTKKIDTQYIHLCEDLTEFNAYPWGRVSYEFLQKWFRGTMSDKATARREKHKGHKGKQNVTHMDIYGFAYALQIWAYEAIPCVGSYCGGDRSLSVVPRMLRWSPTKTFRFKELTQNCFPILEIGDEIADRIKVIPALTPTTAEKRTPYYLSLVSWEEGFNKNNDVPSTLRTRKRKRKDVEVECEGSKLSYTPLLKSLNLKYRRMKKSLKLIIKNQNQIMTLLGIHDEDEDKHEEADEKDDRDEEKDGGEPHEEDEEFEEKDEARVEEKDDRGVDEKDEGGSQQDGNTSDKDEGNRCNTDDEIKDGFGCSDEDEKTDGEECAMNLYNESVDEFEQWYMNDRNSGSKVQVSVENIVNVDVMWFRSIHDPLGWLTCENLDALINLIVYKAKRWPNNFHTGWSCVDVSFWTIMTERVYNSWKKADNKGHSPWLWSIKEKMVIDYVTGRLPLHGMGVPWTEVKRVFGIGHVNQNHWILYELSLVDECIIVYDSQSFGGKMGNPRYLSKVCLLASLMPNIFDQLVKTGPSKDKRPRKKAWEVKISPDAVQQVDSSSCDVVCMKMLECLVSNRPPNAFDPQKCVDFRKKYCSELFNVNNIMSTCYF